MGMVKELVTEKADELALEKYDCHYWELPVNTQEDIFKLAIEIVQEAIDNITKQYAEVK